MNNKLLPLAVLDAAEDETLDGITRFQKLVFLAQREREGADPYEFRADNYGPFSPDLYDDLDRLEAGDYVDSYEEETEMGNTKKVYELTEKGKRAIETFEEEDFPVSADEVESLTNEHEDTDLFKLLEYVYTEYPQMARNSELSLV